MDATFWATVGLVIFIGIILIIGIVIILIIVIVIVLVIVLVIVIVIVIILIINQRRRSASLQYHVFSFVFIHNMRGACISQGLRAD